MRLGVMPRGQMVAGRAAFRGLGLRRGVGEQHEPQPEDEGGRDPRGVMPFAGGREENGTGNKAEGGCNARRRDRRASRGQRRDAVIRNSARVESGWEHESPFVREIIEGK